MRHENVDKAPPILQHDVVQEVFDEAENVLLRLRRLVSVLRGLCRYVPSAC